MTLNHYNKITTRGKFATKYKTEDAKSFELEIDQQMVRHMNDVKAFNDLYDSRIHYLRASYRFYLPVFTKKNLIAKRKNDVDNLIKPLQDCLFNYIKPDDAEVIQLEAMKIDSNRFKMKASFTMHPLKDIL